MKKIILTLIAIICICGTFHIKTIMAEDAKVEIWSNALDERIEHRSIVVGASNPNFNIKITPSGTSFNNVTWSTNNSNIATVTGDSQSATVKGLREGPTKLNLSVNTSAYGRLNYDCVISVYTEINNVPARTNQITTFYRGADLNSWVRSTGVPTTTSFKIIGACSNFYYIELPDSYNFDDNRSSRKAYVLKSHVYVPVMSVDVNKSNLIMKKNDTEQISTQVFPNIATNKSYKYSASNGEVISVNQSGTITAIGEGFSKAIATSNADNKQDDCKVSVITDVTRTKGTLYKNTKLYAGADTSCEVRKNDAKKGDSLTVIAKCGNYYYAEFPQDYFGEGKDNKAFVLIDDVYIPVERIEIVEKSIVININQKKKITVKVYPELASDKSVKFYSEKNNANVNEKYEVFVKDEKYDKFYAMSKEGKRSEKCEVYVLGDRIVEKLDPNGKFQVLTPKTDLDGNYISFTKCEGATEYIVFRSKGNKWEDIYYVYNNTDNYRYVFDEGALLGKKYRYKIVAYYKYVTFNGKELETKRLAKTIYSSEVETGRPEINYKFIKNRKNELSKIKISWNKMHYEYGKKHKVGYRLYRNGKTIKTLENNKTHSFKDSDLKANKEYKYKIKAFYIVKQGKKDKKVWSPKGKIKVSTTGLKVEKKKTSKKKTSKKTSKKSNSKKAKKTTKKTNKKSKKKSKK